MRCSHGNQDRRSISLNLVACSGSSGVEFSGHEDGTTARVEVQHLRGVGGEAEPLGRGPLPDGESATLQDRDVQGVDLLALDDNGLLQLSRRSTSPVDDSGGEPKSRCTVANASTTRACSLSVKRSSMARIC